MRFLSLSRRGLLCVTLLGTAAVPAWAGPGPAALVSPTGELTGSTIVFTWNAVSDSTWYLFWVGSSTQGRPLQQWYSAAQAGCASGAGACSVSLTQGFDPGPLAWYIQTWNATGFGPWSTAAGFSIKDPTPTWSRKLSGARRFALIFDGAGVLDNETGLVWQQAPFDGTAIWSDAAVGCMGTSIGGRWGWRLPSASEVTSVADPNQALGSPFNLGTDMHFWTQTNLYDTQSILLVHFVGADLHFDTQTPKTEPHRAWCVRGNGSDRVQ